MLPKLFTEEVEKSLKRHIMPAYEGTYELRVAKLGDDAGAMGAAAWSQQSVISTALVAVPA